MFVELVRKKITAMGPPPSWLHCNLCMSQRCRGLLMTSCGKVVCSNCKPKLKSVKCKSCQGACNRTVQLNSKTPTEVTKLFTDVSSELKSVFKSVDFQNGQIRSIMKHKRKRLAYGRSVIAKRKKRWSQLKSKKMTIFHEIENIEEQINATEVSKYPQVLPVRSQ